MEPKGQLFRHVYMRRNDLQNDSERMRIRLAHVFYDHDAGELNQLIPRYIGVRTGALVNDTGWVNLLREIEIADALGIVTLCWRQIQLGNATEAARQRYLMEIADIFSEEQVGYRVDGAGGVHRAVDQAFEDTRTLTIVALSARRYLGVRALFDEAYAALDEQPPNGKQALRSSFHAVESLFRLMFPTAPQLSVSEIQKHLEPHVNRVYSNQKPAVNLAQKLVASLRDWVDGAHFYRHEPGTQEPAQPPLELAVYMLSQAAGHIRWLATIDVAE